MFVYASTPSLLVRVKEERYVSRQDTDVQRYIHTSGRTKKMERGCHWLATAATPAILWSRELPRREADGYRYQLAGSIHFLSSSPLDLQFR